MRVLPGQVNRAVLRTTLIYRWKPRVHIGIEYNPKVGEAHPLLTLIPVTETLNRPAIIIGVSSDRIGTPSGTSFYVTASKDLEHWTGVPIAPYAGVVYGTHQDRFRPIGGLNIRFTPKLNSLFQYDGVKLHHGLTYTFNDRHSLTFLLVRMNRPGFSYTLSF